MTHNMIIANKIQKLKKNRNKTEENKQTKKQPANVAQNNIRNHVRP